MKQKVRGASSECGSPYADPEGMCKCGKKEKTDTFLVDLGRFLKENTL